MDSSLSANKNISRGPEVQPPSEQPTFGMQLVGINFNPSGDPKVHRAKELFAQVADLVKTDFDKEPASELKSQLYNHTIGEILNAQMNVVKLLTLKY